MALKTIDLGPVSSYAIAVAKGYTGTEDEWYELISSITQQAQDAADSADAAAESERNAATSETNAARSAQDAAASVQEVTAAKTAAIAAIQQEGATQIAAVETAGTTQVGNVRDTGTEAVQAVQRAGTDQITDIGTAADEALDEIAQGSAVINKLLLSEIPGTTQTPIFSDGQLARVEHTSGGAAVRTDVFTFSNTQIVEVRTLSTGESVTLTTNLETLQTVITAAA